MTILKRYIFLKWEIIILSVVITAVINIDAVAQKDKIDRANKLFALKSYHRAISIFESAINKYRNQEAIANLAESYRMINDQEKAAFWYKDIVNGHKANPEYFLNYARSLYAQGKFKEAKLWFQKYADHDTESQYAIDMIRQCEKIYSLIEDSINYKIIALETNSAYSEFAPALYHDGLVYVSSREKNGWGKYNPFKEKTPYFNLFYSKKNDDLTFSNPQQFSKKLNTRFHEGAVTFNKAEDVIYFTRNNFNGWKKNKDSSGVVRLKIYRAELRNGSWGNITEFQYNNNSYSNGYPSLSVDGQLLFFVSDKTGGYGGTDIYLTTKQQNGWSPPVNLGPEINTPDNETAPFIHQDGTLYFSSDGHPGFGGLDIYSATIQNGKWGDVTLLKPPLNSNKDDFGFIIDENKQSGYLSSDRTGGIGEDDIYFFKKSKPTFNCVHEVESNSYSYTFYEESSIDSMKLPLEYEWDFGFGIKKRGLEVEHTFPGPGAYIINLNVIDSITGAVFFNEASYKLNIEDINQVYIRSRDTCITDLPFYFDGLETKLDSCEIEEYYWDFGDGNTAVGSKVSHIYTKPGNYKVELGIMGFSGEYTCKECSYKIVTILTEKQAKASDYTYDKNSNVEEKRKLQLSKFLPKKDQVAFKILLGYRNDHSIRNIIFEKLPELEKIPFKILKETRKHKRYLIGPFTDYDAALHIKNKLVSLKDKSGINSVAICSYKNDIQIPIEKGLAIYNSYRFMKDPIKNKNKVESLFAPKLKADISFKVQLLRSDHPIALDSLLFAGFDQIQEYTNDQSFLYTTGSFKDLPSAYPLFKIARDSGFKEAQINAFQYNQMLSQGNPTFHLKLPEDYISDYVILNGILTKDNGQPLACEIKWEDLLLNEIVGKTITDPDDGSFSIRFQKGKFYGYYTVLDGYFPYSNYIDLRKEVEITELKDSVRLISKHTKSDRSIALTFNNIFFDFGSFNLMEASFPELNRVAEFLKENSHIKVNIIGHTDDVGSEEYNEILSQKRAETVINYLINRGCKEENIVPLSFGETSPIADNKSGAGRALNRRVEIKLIRL